MATQSVVSIKFHSNFIKLVNPAAALQTAVAALWTKLGKIEISLNAVVLIWSTTSVPYKTAYDTQPFICQARMDKLNGMKGKGVKSDCLACSIPIKDLQCNMGIHILHTAQDTNTCTALWHYNLEAHLDNRHSEYAHPGKPQGLPLPHEMYNIIFLTNLDSLYFVTNVPLWPLFHNIQNKENVAPANACVQKCRLDSTTFSKAASLLKKAKQ
ncbi:hypothetical protein PAXRUDRAFT_30049 [Paxillus rubicundulus Ve08.2h10]|uniref:Uncharacterized protein n=1 Tax=Paxillus rubicundulus Ve08.2h10 TaxID=930991 RepID=A0A0D0EA97_9AGAM|nr:hypothetical protein PAXRUDRAFT_30049 [Paxillus rubicundulus Ve08.2h10]